MFIAALMANGEVHNDPTRFEGATLVSAGALPAYNIDIDKKAKLALNPMYAVIGGYLLNHTCVTINKPEVSVNVHASPLTTVRKKLVVVNLPLAYGEMLHNALMDLGVSIQERLEVGIPPVFAGNRSLLTIMAGYLPRFTVDAQNPRIGVSLVANLGDESWHSNPHVEKFALMTVEGIDAEGWKAIDHAPVEPHGLTFLDFSIKRVDSGFLTVPRNTYDPVLFLDESNA